MAVAKTESRLPAGFSANDLGQAVVDGSSQAALISCLASPIVLGRRQTYVVLVPDAALSGNVASYRWQVEDLDANTSEGVWEYTPSIQGEIDLNVTLQDSSNAVLKSLSLPQTVVPLNPDLENLIVQDDAVHPVAGDPATSREIINDMLAHIHAVAPLASGEEINRLLFGVAYVEALDHPQADRDRLITSLRTALNDSNPGSFFQQASPGAGVCRIRPEILAMVVESGGNPLVPWQELPADAAARDTALQAIWQQLETLGEQVHIDLFNMVRFPKANLKVCKQIFNALRIRYFDDSSYDTILRTGTQAAQLIEQFKTGPSSMTP